MKSENEFKHEQELANIERRKAAFSRSRFWYT